MTQLCYSEIFSKEKDTLQKYDLDTFLEIQFTKSIRACVRTYVLYAVILKVSHCRCFKRTYQEKKKSSAKLEKTNNWLRVQHNGI